MSDVIDCRSTPVTSIRVASECLAAVQHSTWAIQRSRGKGSAHHIRSSASSEALLETSWLSCTLTLELADLMGSRGQLRAGAESERKPSGCVQTQTSQLFPAEVAPTNPMASAG